MDQTGTMEFMLVMRNLRIIWTEQKEGKYLSVLFTLLRGLPLDKNLFINQAKLFLMYFFGQTILFEIGTRIFLS